MILYNKLYKTHSDVKTKLVISNDIMFLNYLFCSYHLNSDLKTSII